VAGGGLAAGLGSLGEAVDEEVEQQLEAPVLVGLIDSTPEDSMTQGMKGRPGVEDRSFAVRSERHETVERVRVGGEMDFSVVAELDSEMRRAEATDAKRIELDLNQLEFLDAAGIRLLLDLKQRSRSNGNRLRIRPASSPQVQRVLQLTGVGELLPIDA
jgi:anti-anti-sigma factor